MEDLFGKSGVGSAPSGTICSTPLFNTTSSQTKSSIAQATGSQEQPLPEVHSLPEEQPGPSTAMPSKEMHRRRQTSTFCEVYEAHSERRTAALESLVRPDLERRRRLKERRRRMFEKKSLTCLGEILEQLKKISKSQEMLIDLLKNKV
jgi:hypothetical protein